MASNQRIIHSNLRARLHDSSVVLLGYSLHDWEFKVFFRVLVSMIRHKAKGFYVQLKDSEQELKYLEYYLKSATFDPVWMDTLDFLLKLWRTNRGAESGAS